MRRPRPGPKRDSLCSRRRTLGATAHPTALCSSYYKPCRCRESRSTSLTRDVEDTATEGKRRAIRLDRVGAGLVTGPSHTTGHAVFRIRRLSPAASGCREVGWNEESVLLHQSFIQRFHSRPFAHGTFRGPPGVALFASRALRPGLRLTVRCVVESARQTVSWLFGPSLRLPFTRHPHYYGFC